MGFTILLLPLVVVVDVVDRWSRRQVRFITMVMVVVVIAGVLVADQCRGHTNTSPRTQAHSCTALTHTQQHKRSGKSTSHVKCFNMLIH